RLDGGLRELGPLVGRRRARGAFDPREGVTDVFLRDPWRVALDLEAEIALLEQDRPPVAAQHRVAQARLEPVPARRQCAGYVPHVLVVHAEHCAEAVLFHHRARALDAVLAHAFPVDALLPIKAGNAEICCAHDVPPDPARFRVRCWSKSYAGWTSRLNNIFCLLPSVFLMSCFSGVSWQMSRCVKSAPSSPCARKAHLPVRLSGKTQRSPASRSTLQPSNVR